MATAGSQPAMRRVASISSRERKVETSARRGLSGLARASGARAVSILRRSSLSDPPKLCHYSSKLTSVMAYRSAIKNLSSLKTLTVLMLCLAVWTPIPVDAAEITVAAASDLTYAFKDVASQFEKQTGSSVKLSYGSSGN